MSAVEVRELSVRARETALRRVDLTVRADEAVLLLGDVGTSVLLRAMAGVLAPAAGAVRLFGEDVAGLPDRAVAARGVAYVPGDWRPYDVPVGVLSGPNGALVAVARRAPRVLLVDGLVGAAEVLAQVRGRGVAVVVAARVAFDGRTPLPPAELDVTAYDRVYAVHEGRVRPWLPGPPPGAAGQGGDG